MTQDKITRTTVVTKGELALCLGVTASAVASYDQSGVVSKAGRGKYLLVESLEGHRNHKTKSFKDSDGNTVDYDKERARKVKFEADKLERQRQIDDLQLLEAEKYAALIAEAIQIQKRELAALPLALQRLVPGMSDKAIQDVTKTCARAHNAILDLAPDPEVES